MACGARDPKIRRSKLDSCKQEWWTPDWLWKAARRVMGGIDLDPCSNSHETPNVPARCRYTKNEDGLAHPWRGRVFLNPPYGRQISRWVAKAVAEYEAGNISEAVLVVPACLETRWFSPLWNHLLCVYRGRIRFIDGETGDIPSEGIPGAVAFIYLGPKQERFRTVFSPFGPIATDLRGNLS